MTEPNDFREVMGEFATGVTVVTLPGDPPHGITVNAFASLSMEPPLVLVCLDHGTEAYRLLADGDCDGYCVNILTQEQRHLGEYFAGMSAESTEPFAEEQTRTGVAAAPIFDESLAYIDCTLHDEFEAGDHTIYAGRVEQAEVLQRDGEPLVFYEGNWKTVA